MQPNGLVVGPLTMLHQDVSGPRVLLEVSSLPRPIPKVPFIHSFLFHAHVHYIIHLCAYSFIQIPYSQYQVLNIKLLLLLLLLLFQFSSA